ncbi:MAG: TRAM domain-containing protein [Gemmatimonadota bacterium]
MARSRSHQPGTRRGLPRALNGETPGSAAHPVEKEFRVLRIAGGGDGVGRLSDGRTVFVPRTAPGDLVEVQYFMNADRYSRARLVRVLEPGPSRVVPPCPHYIRDQCGGCQVQHLTLGAQLSAKQSIVGEALRRVGHIEIEDPVVLPGGRAWEYRTKITLTVDASGRIGLHPWDRPDKTFDLEHCHITDSSLMALWSVVRRHRRLLPANTTHLILRLDRQGGRHLIARVTGPPPWQSAGALAQALTGAGVPTVLWWEPEGGAARVVSGASDAYPATVFEQVNPEMGDMVRTYALDRLGPVRDRHVWDLYSGIGESTERLVRAGARVESVESDPRAVRLAENRLRALLKTPHGPLPNGLSCRLGKVEEIASRLGAPDLILTNPPRGGMEAKAIQAITERSPERLVYISCDPATLARDIARLASTHRASHVQAFDLFPQTAHVESVAVLDRI